MKKYKILGFDLDGTLLDQNRILRQRTIDALALASSRGANIAITSGRYFPAVPKEIRDLSFIRYFILCNGAAIYDRDEDRILYECAIPLDTSLAIYRDMSEAEVYYDCYMSDGAWAEADHLRRIREFVSDPSHIKVLEDTRTPKENLIEALKQRGKSIYKIQSIYKDTPTRDRELAKITSKYPTLAVTTAYTYNLEVNMPEATKGKGLMRLAQILGIDREDTAAFGDGGNDISMLEEAGTGYAMANASDDIKSHADLIAPLNSEDGVAQVLEEIYG